MRTAMDPAFTAPRARGTDDLPLFAAPPAPPAPANIPANIPARPQDHAPQGALTAAQHETFRALVPVARALMRTGGPAGKPGTLRAWEVLLEGMHRGILERPVPQSFSRRMPWFMAKACAFVPTGERERVPAEHFPDKHSNICTVWRSASGGAP
jgi:hypothetical protein